MKMNEPVIPENPPSKTEAVSSTIALFVTAVFVLLAAFGDPKKPNPFNALYYHIVSGDSQGSVSVSR
ncbi:MAG: hypothetical protein JST75_18750 [Bacteroidetes bacterium]|nr:hypothetical protein [Bacteroidota bacterium]